MQYLQPPPFRKPRNPLPLPGERFNRWTLIEFEGWLGTAQSWKCVCECGKVKNLIRLGDLRSGKTKSCGCLPIDINTKHKKCHLSEYRIWTGMKQRCYNPKNPAYKNYGGRGITVCERWRNCFVNFLTDMGIRPTKKHSIDRKDNNKNYSPDNCIWQTSEYQNNNRRNTAYMHINGEKIAIQLASRKYGIKYATIVARLARGVLPEDAIKRVGESNRN